MEKPAVLLRRLNPYCARALEEAASLCQTRAHALILPEHWLLKLLEQGEGDLTVLARRYKWDMEIIWQDLLSWLDNRPRSVRSRPQLSGAIKSLLKGWLIVVAGHTDNTGSATANQALSLKRAEALRNWMLLASDVSATCFAVQGYGATQPRATNDTVEGREANRRVEISLVPQVDACKGPAPQDLSNE